MELVLQDLEQAATQCHRDLEFRSARGLSLISTEFTLSRIFQLNYRATRNKSDGSDSLRLSYTVLRGSNFDRVGIMEIAERIGDLDIALNGYYAVAAQIFDFLIDTMQEDVSEGHTLFEKKKFLMEWSRMPIFAAPVVLDAGRAPLDILERLETSRSLIWDRSLNKRADIQRLRAEKPALCEELDHITKQMHNQLKATMVDGDPGPVYYAQQHQDVVDRICEQPGFESFMNWKLSVDNLMMYCANGPVVTFVHAVKCYALIACGEEVSKLPLHRFNEQECSAQFSKFQNAIVNRHADRDVSSRRLLEILKWLWLAAAKPVLKFLGFTTRTKEQHELPRIWWVTSGWVNALPIHAAGDFELTKSSDIPCTVMDLAVSSYTPTFRALLNSRDCEIAINASENIERPRALLISMKPTPGLPVASRLPNPQKMWQKSLQCYKGLVISSNMSNLHLRQLTRYLGYNLVH
jgi:hypothetical protein